MYLKRMFVLAVFVLPFAVNVNAAGFSLSLDDPKVKFSGVVDFSMGEVMRGKYRTTVIDMGYFQDPELKCDIPVSHIWFGNPLARFNLEFSPGDRLKMLLGFEGNLFLNNFPTEYKTSASANGGLPVFPQYMDWRIHQAQGIMSLLKDETVSLDLSLGVMPYKYNPEVRNLGEFMFRSGTYPFFLINNFNFPLARLTGLRLNFTYGSEALSVCADQFALIERDLPPLNDISFATAVGAKILNIVDVGAAVNFARAIPVNSTLTSSKNGIYVDTSAGYPDTGYYTFQGTKVMARMTVDPFGMLRSDKESIIGELLGENGGKIYGEWAIIGLKNYPASFETLDFVGLDPKNPWGYTKISERMPWMAGINLPMWKLLDVCAFEVEKYPAPYPNDYYQACYNQVIPVPTFVHMYRTPPNGTPGYDSAAYAADRWYWSLYIKKKLLNHFSIIGQVARDHMRWDVNTGLEFNYDTEEIMPKAGQWTWRIGMLYEF
jgi:hypothetical protein